MAMSMAGSAAERSEKAARAKIASSAAVNAVVALQNIPVLLWGDELFGEFSEQPDHKHSLR